MSGGSYEFLELYRAGRVLTVVFNGPNSVNSLTNALMRELTQLAVELREDPDISAIILTGKSEIFCAGMDLKDPENAASRNARLSEQRVLAQVGPRMCEAWETLEPVTIAAIEGWCIGGGLALAVSCDWRVAGSDSQFRVPEIQLGMNMSWQSVPRIVSLIGPAKAKRLLLLGDTVSVDLAHEWGIVDFKCPSGNSVDRANSLASQVAAMPPVPVRMAKRGINAAASALSNSVSFMDFDQLLLAQSSEDANEAVEAFFEKRDPVFKGA